MGRFTVVIATVLCGFVIGAQPLALGVADFSNKEALSKGAEMAVSQLGKQDGFMGDSRVKAQLADKYNQYADKASKLGLLSDKDANIDAYVTQKALDGLYLMIAEQEKAIRKDPMGRGSKLLQSVFGALGR